ncbi:MAG: universal stress protein [Desulfobulbaceae bacterium]|nr:universal stress protein [Desulfobulbaceae bacterium]HIJ78330.1 universal stress protein [Deltaproteobacteria bacterium]
MQKVLLVINGLTPNQKALDYALQLCERIKAELKILLVVKPEVDANWLSSLKKKARLAKNIWEEAMMAAAFAEADVHEAADELMDQALANIKKLLSASKAAGIPCQLIVEKGEAEKKTAEFVEENSRVVVTVYDAPEAGQGKRGPGQSLQKILPIPVVMLQTAGQET